MGEQMNESPEYLATPEKGYKDEVDGFQIKTYALETGDGNKFVSYDRLMTSARDRSEEVWVTTVEPSREREFNMTGTQRVRETFSVIVGKVDAVSQDYARDAHLAARTMISEDGLRLSALENGILKYLHGGDVVPSDGPETVAGETETPRPVEIYTTIGEVVKAAVSRDFVAVYGSFYRSEDEADYFCFPDKDTHEKFTQLIKVLKDDYSYDVADELRNLVGSNWVDTAHLYPVYRDGVWKTDLGGVSQDEISTKLQRDDDDWFDAQREYFSDENVLQRSIDAEDLRAEREQARLESEPDDDHDTP